MPETDKLAVSNWMMMVVMMLMMLLMMMMMLMAAINHRLAEGSKNDTTRTDQWMPKNHINMENNNERQFVL
jgi:heme/copper-type cytochrome/quinol oxidase subunit 2